MPAGSDGVTAFFYNKRLLAEAGLDPEQDWPANIDDFFTYLDTLAESGVTPMTLGSDAIIWQVLLWWIGQTIGGAPGFGEFANGERNFSDPEIVNIIQRGRVSTITRSLARKRCPGASRHKSSPVKRRP